MSSQLRIAKESNATATKIDSSKRRVRKPRVVGAFSFSQAKEPLKDLAYYLALGRELGGYSDHVLC